VIVHVRSPGVPDEPSDDRADTPTPPQHHSLPVSDRVPLSYRVAAWVVLTKFALAAVFALAALLANGRTPMIIAALAAVGMVVYGLRDVVARERLRVEADGLTVVHGFAGRGRLGWDQIERVRVDERLRLGVRTQLLEVDAGDWIGLYGRYELDAEPEAVVAAIDAARRGPRSH
jgi:hypothetical protein